MQIIDKTWGRIWINVAAAAAAVFRSLTKLCKENGISKSRVQVYKLLFMTFLLFLWGLFLSFITLVTLEGPSSQAGHKKMNQQHLFVLIPK